MRLFEAIVEANHRAVAGDSQAGLHPSEFTSELPVVALTCIDPRLNALFPSVLGLPAEQFIWTRNAGNIITGPLSSTMRSLALACAIKGGQEIALIGHTDCLVAKTTMMQLLERFAALGIERRRLPENLNEFLALFASERQNVVKCADIVRRSPLIGPKVPVHGLIVDIETGKLEWIVNGYETAATVAGGVSSGIPKGEQTLDALAEIGNLALSELKFPETKIGEAAATAQQWVAQAEAAVEKKFPPEPPQPTALPPKLPLPPPIKMKLDFRKVKVDFRKLRRR